MRYRRKDAEIDAFQWFPELGEVGGVTIGTWMDGPWEGLPKYLIETLEGFHVISPGDWVITGIKGENYACKPHIFTDLYYKA